MERGVRIKVDSVLNRPVEDWGKLVGDVAAVTAMLDRLLHHGHVLKCGPRSWRTKLAAASLEAKTGHRKRKVFLMNQDTELDACKREIDLRQFAVSLGYEMNRRESWRGSTVLRRGADKIVVKR